MNIENIRKNVNQFMNLLAEEGLIKVTGFDEKTKTIQDYVPVRTLGSHNMLSYELLEYLSS